uniref:Uncharacterized protein n=1 Tax=Ditylenchus dipsaci TaxID=166011 RepID=A0A915E0G0_9BILA
MLAANGDIYKHKVVWSNFCSLPHLGQQPLALIIVRHALNEFLVNQYENSHHHHHHHHHHHTTTTPPPPPHHHHHHHHHHHLPPASVAATATATATGGHELFAKRYYIQVLGV